MSRALMDYVRSMNRGVLNGFNLNVGSMLPASRWLERPPGMNSIGWVMWHIARTEDLLVNAVARTGRQVFGDGWPQKIGFDESRTGMGFRDDELGVFASVTRAEAILEYWQAVKEETNNWLKASDPSILDQVPDYDLAASSMKENTYGPGNAGLELWKGSNVLKLMSGPIISHGHNHVGEMMAIRSQLGVSGL